MAAKVIALAVLAIVTAATFAIFSLIDRRSSRARNLKERLAGERKPPERTGNFLKLHSGFRVVQKLKDLEDPQKLIGVLRDNVDRFQRETGIGARFVTDLDELDMPQRVCRETVRIVQEGLVNVRKHSGARHALVRLASTPEQWNLTLEDDGKGFPFTGCYNTQQMKEAGIGPMIIMERVSLLAGELTVESNPGQGTRLEVRVPRNGDFSHEL